MKTPGSESNAKTLCIFATKVHHKKNPALVAVFFLWCTFRHGENQWKNVNMPRGSEDEKRITGREEHQKRSSPVADRDGIRTP
jgi:hypothetical protein